MPKHVMVGSSSERGRPSWVDDPARDKGVRHTQQMLAARSLAEPRIAFRDVAAYVASPDFVAAAVADVSSRPSAQTAGVDGVTRAHLNELGDDRVVAAVRASLLTVVPTWAPSRVVTIPKPGGGTRSIHVPTLFDRMRERSMQLVLAPIAEPRMAVQSHGFRFARGPQTALDAVLRLLRNPRVMTVVETDVADFFPSLRHEQVLAGLVEDVDDAHVQKLITALMSRSPAGAPKANRGVPQGGPLSPLLANIAFNAADCALLQLPNVVDFIRYADDLLIGVDGSQEVGEQVLAQFEGLLLHRYGLQVSRKKTFVRPVGDKSSTLGHHVWRAADGRAEIVPLPDRIDRLHQKLIATWQGTDTHKEVTPKEKNKRMKAAVVGWASYYRPRHLAEQLAAAVLAEVQGRASTWPPSGVRPSGSFPQGMQALSESGDSTSHNEASEQLPTWGTARSPFSSGGAATNSRPEDTGDQDRSCAAPTRTETRSMDRYDARMAKMLSAMENLSALTGDTLIHLLGEAVACFAEVKSELATVQVELLPLTDQKRRRIVFLRDTAFSEALGVDFSPSWRERTFQDGVVTELVDRIRELEADKVRLNAEREVCDRVMRTLGYAIERRSGKA